MWIPPFVRHVTGCCKLCARAGYDSIIIIASTIIPDCLQFLPPAKPTSTSKAALVHITSRARDKSHSPSRDHSSADEHVDVTVAGGDELVHWVTMPVSKQPQRAAVTTPDSYSGRRHGRQAAFWVNMPNTPIVRVTKSFILVAKVLSFSPRSLRG